MAKGYALSGNISGKKGSSVFYQLTNSNNKVTQGVREYTADVSNPKTLAQAQQRMRMTPAVNFYRGLQEILNHSFEGKKYGGRNYAQFMKLALSANFDGRWPYLDMGNTAFVPGEYTVSQGSLIGIETLRVANFGDDNRPHLYVNNNFIYPTNGTTEQVRATFFAAYPQLQEGDQVTVIAIEDDGENSIYIPHVYRLVLTRENLDYYLNDWVNAVEDGVPGFDQNTIAIPDIYQIAAGCVIVSRPTVSGSTVTWRRSTARLVCSGMNDYYYSRRRYNQALASYMTKAVNAKSEWYLNQGETAMDGSEVIPPNSEITPTNYSNLLPSAIWTGQENSDARLRTCRLESVGAQIDAYVVEIAAGTGNTGRATGYQFNSDTQDFDAMPTITLAAGYHQKDGVNIVSKAEAKRLMATYGWSGFVVS